MDDDLIWMVLALLGVACVVLGPIAFFMVLGQRSRLAEAERRIITLRDQIVALESRPRPAAPDEARPQPEPQPQSEPHAPQAEPQAPEVPAEPVSGEAELPPSQGETTPEPPTPAPQPVPIAARRSLEEALGTRWTVWVGGVALGLGALLLVRYSFEQGFFGPGARVLMGLLLAAALVTAGEVLRRRQRNEAPARVDIPSVLTACGAVAAFGAIYAAYGVYGFIDGLFAFLALAVVALACMLAAALHGPALASLGLLGSFATPLLVASADPNPFALVVYLAVVAAAAQGLARLRRWRWLALASVVGALAWMVPLWIGLAAGTDSARIFQAGSLHLIAQSLLAGYALAYAPYRTSDANVARFDPAGWLPLAAFAVAAEGWLATAGVSGQFGMLWVAVAGAMALLLASLGLARRPMTPLFVASGAFTLFLLDGWPGPVLEIVHPVYWMPGGFAVGLMPLAPMVYGGFAIAASLALGAAGAQRLRRDGGMSFLEGTLLGGTATLTGLGALVVAWLRIGIDGTDFLFAALAALLAAAFVFGATVFRQDLAAAPEADRDRFTFGLGIFASASFAALALALVFALQGGTLTVALALAALGCAHVSVRLQIAALRWCVAAFALAIAARLAWDPRIVGDALGKTPIFNWLLFGYGVPAVAMGLSSRLMRRAGGEDTPVRVAQAACILLSGFLVLFEIRHALYDGDILAASSEMVEQGLDTFAALGFAVVLTRLDAVQSSLVFRVASYGFGLVSLASAVLGLGILENPFLLGDRVRGGAVINTLLLAYAMPAVAAYVLARFSEGRRHQAYVMALRVVTMLLTFAYLTLETRRLFHADGDLTFWRSTSDAEFYAYSAVWLGFALVLLAYGVWRGSREARLGSAVFLVLTVMKVFLLDLSGLEGLLRAVSFIGLGLVLIGVGLVYQKLVFRPQPADVL